MGLLFFALLLGCFLRSSFQYRAAVVEYASELSTDENIKRYAAFIEQAAKEKKADIVVFPEGTLTRQVRSFQLVPHPDDGVIPYKNESYDKYRAVSAMSEAAARNNIYVVVNLLERFNCVNGSEDCPDRGYFLYNTNVAFDRQGTVVARYRKFNLFMGSVDKPKTAELSTFTTDFGVTFGMFICFDILFKTPTIDLVQKKNVTNLIFSTLWFGELPFLTAAQIQSGWSYAMNVNLLASGGNRPSVGSTGSGIYIGRKRKTAYMVELHGDAMIVDGIDRGRSTEATNVKGSSLKKNGLRLKQDPTVPFAKGVELNIGGGTLRDQICHNGLCCNFSVKYRKSGLDNAANYTYRAVAFNGRRYYRENVLRDVNYCAILLCVDGNCAKKPANGSYPLVFDEINIDAAFREKDTIQLPSTLMWQDDVLLYSYLHAMNYDMFVYDRKKIPGTDKVNASIKLTKKDVGNIITFGVHGRDFTI